MKNKRILCYGDSNTWGYIPGTGQRFDDDVRWTGVLQTQLGIDYTILEEGLSGRTTAMDNGADWTRNGSKLLLPVLQSHAPLDLVLVMLGTNDVKAVLQATPEKISQNMKYIVRAIKRAECGRGSQPPKILVIAPPPLGRMSGEVKLEFTDGGREKSLRLANFYHDVAAAESCAFFDAGSAIHTSEIDGVHFDAEEHRILGKTLAEEIRLLLRDNSLIA